jgi:hypothetical protein
MVAISYCLLLMSYRLVNINYTLVSRLLKRHIPPGGINTLTRELANLS